MKAELTELLDRHPKLLMACCGWDKIEEQSKRRKKYFKGKTYQELIVFVKETCEQYNCVYSLEINENIKLPSDVYDELYEFLEEIEERFC